MGDKPFIWDENNIHKLSCNFVNGISSMAERSLSGVAFYLFPRQESLAHHMDAK